MTKKICVNSRSQFFFFFQAEDGIRDGTVTGVQTCALPILLSRQVEPRSPGWWLRSFIVVILAIVLTSPQLYFAWTVSVAEVQANAQQAQARSEERRVGKECRTVCAWYL